MYFRVILNRIRANALDPSSRDLVRTTSLMNRLYALFRSHNLPTILRKLRWRLLRGVRRWALVARSRMPLSSTLIASITDIEPTDCRTFLFVGSNLKDILTSEHIQSSRHMHRILRHADKALDGTIYIHGAGWTTLDEDSQSHGRFTNQIHRYDVIVPLVQAWLLTREEVYAQKSRELIIRWITANARFRWQKSEKAIQVGFRLMNWVWVLQHLIEPVPDNHRRTLASAMVRQLQSIQANLSPGGNHLVVEALALYCIGAIIRNGNGPSRFMWRGKKLLEAEIRRQVSVDGIHTEQSMFYHQVVATHFLKAYLTAQNNDDSFSDEFVRRLRAMLDFVHASMKPDFTHPMTGDGDQFTSEDREHIEAKLLLAARAVLFNDPICDKFRPALNDSCWWYLGQPIDSVPVLTAPLSSEIYSETGLAVLRHGDSYVFLDAAPYGDAEFPHHGHADALSVEIVLDGATICMDPGGYGYVDDQFRHYFRSTQAHSTVTINNMNQTQTFGIFGQGKRATTHLLNFDLSNSIDWVTANQDGYSPIIHTRTVMLVRNEAAYVVVVDHIDGPVGRSNTINVRFQLPPEALFDAKTAVIRCFGLSEKSFAIQSFVNGFNKVGLDAIFANENSPVAWLSRNTFSLEQGTTVLIEYDATSLPASILTLIVPNAYSISASSDQSALVVRGKNCHDVIRFPVGISVPHIDLDSTRIEFDAIKSENLND